MAETVSFSYFDAAFQALFADVTERALAQDRLLVTSPGSIVALEKGGKRYLYWRAYDPAGKRRDEYIGPEEADETRAKVAEIEARIGEARGFAERSLALRKQGFAAADNSAAVTLAALFNAGLFRHGAMLVGSHAYGALLNMLGVKLRANYSTEDIDIARYARIQIALRPEESFLTLLLQSGLPFVEVPELDLRRPSTSYRVRGRALKVDLLVPGDRRYRSIRVPELGAHATGLPYFEYLLAEPVSGIVLGRDHAIPVRLPSPARYCLHKLVVATLRVPTSAQKADKDLAQAAVLAAALTDKFEGDLAAAARALPEAARSKASRACKRAAAMLPERNAAARDFLASL